MSAALMPAAVALGIWWNANTIAHLFIHRPFFRGRAANASFAIVLTLLQGFPQALWRDRHLAHHSERPWRLRISGELIGQAALVFALWAAMAATAPAFFVWAYLPGYAGGLLLCALHGHYEHAGGTTSHYGWLYNALCFNDGYHVEHHRFPGLSWRELPARREYAAPASAWPAPARWLEGLTGVAQGHSPAIATMLDALECIVLRSHALQQLVLNAHARALAPLLAGLPPPRRVVIVGGGLFPRTALIVRRLMPNARITIIDASHANIDRARAILSDDRVRFVEARYDPQSEITNQPALCNLNSDLWIFPLAFNGQRNALYAQPPASTVIVHDWIWRARGTSRIVSLALLKRVNLVRRQADTTSARVA